MPKQFDILMVSLYKLTYYRTIGFGFDSSKMFNNPFPNEFKPKRKALGIDLRTRYDIDNIISTIRVVYCILKLVVLYPDLLSSIRIVVSFMKLV